MCSRTRENPASFGPGGSGKSPVFQKRRNPVPVTEGTFPASLSFFLPGDDDCYACISAVYSPGIVSMTTRGKVPSTKDGFDHRFHTFDSQSEPGLSCLLSRWAWSQVGLAMSLLEPRDIKGLLSKLGAIRGEKEEVEKHITESRQGPRGPGFNRDDRYEYSV